MQSLENYSDKTESFAIQADDIHERTFPIIGDDNKQ